MKTLILFYSRTGMTKKVAEKLAVIFNADTEEVCDTVNRSGAGGYLLSGRDATFKKLTILKPLTHDISKYELVIIGTPIWAWTMSTPVRTLLTEQKDKINKVAFFCTQGGSGAEKAFIQMAQLLNKQPVASFSLLTKEVAQDKMLDVLNNFAAKINNA
jgi:flavodoxin